MKMLCQVFRSNREEELYLFVDRNDGLNRVPKELLERFGDPQQVTIFPLTPERKLARANAETVIAAIKDKGFYLQLPPAKDAYMQVLRERNDKL